MRCKPMRAFLLLPTTKRPRGFMSAFSGLQMEICWPPMVTYRWEMLEGVLVIIFQPSSALPHHRPQLHEQPPNQNHTVMSLIVRFTAALWAALTNINADHQQSKLRLINNLLPHSRHCNINVALWHSSLRHTHNPPHCTRERGKKNVTLLLKKKMKGARAQAQQPSPRLPRLPVSPSFAWAQAQQPSPLFVWYCVSPYTVVP